jgi:regulator of sigma E protease
MLTILAPILVFGLVIFVHELGHFLAAKAMGVYAPRFSIGFGPTLWRHRWGETEYVLALLPLGGYVRMASRHDEDIAFLEGGSEDASARKADDPDYDPDALRPFGPHPVPEQRLFESKRLPARLLILIAGVTMNVVLALVVAIGLALAYGRPVIGSRTVGDVPELSSAPALAALHPLDTVKAVNGQPVRNWSELLRLVGDAEGPISVATNRGTVQLRPAGAATPSSEELRAALQYAYFVPTVIDTVMADGRAHEAGIQRGDSIIAVGGVPVVTWGDLVSKVSSSPERPLEFRLARAGAERTLTVTPRATRESDDSGAEHTVGKIGAGPKSPEITNVPVGVTEAVVFGWRQTWFWGGTIVGFVKKIFTGEVGVRQLGGPVAITKASVQAARGGLEQLFALIAFLSINIAVLNLLPIPILDGGQIVMNVIESAKGSPFSMRTREYILRFGLVAIALIFITVMYNDTRGGLAKVFGWIARLFS